MPVTVQLPGYNHNAPGVGLADLINTASNVYSNSKKNDLMTQETQAAQMTNQQTQMQLNIQKQQAAQLNNQQYDPKTDTVSPYVDPNTGQPGDSPLTKSTKAQATGLLQALQDTGAAKQGSFAPILDIINSSQTTGLNVAQLMDQMKPQLELAKENLAKQGQIGAATNRTAPQVDRNSKGIGDDYRSGIAPYKDVQDSISRVESILNTKDKNGKLLITPQQIGDANLAISRIFSPNHQSDSTVSATEYQSLPAEFAAAMQRLSANPHDSNSRALVEHIVDQAHHIGNVSNQNAIKSLDDLDAANKNLMNPTSAATAASISKQLRSRFNKSYPEAGGAPKQSGGGRAGVPVNADLSKMNPAQLQDYINTHGG